MKQLPSSHSQLISPAHPCAAENGMCLNTLPPDPSPWLQKGDPNSDVSIPEPSQVGVGSWGSK